VGEIFLASKKAQKRSPLQGAVVADGAAQHGITDLKRVEDGTLRDRTCDFDFDFASNVGKGAKMLWEFDSNHVTPTRLNSPRKNDGCGADGCIRRRISPDDALLYRSFLYVKSLPVVAFMNPNFTKDAV
jgi:hypothetical protein